MTKKPFVRSLIVASLAGTACAPSAHAQVYERTAPKLPPKSTLPEIKPPPLPQPIASSTAPVVSKLLGLIFVAGNAKLNAGGLPVAAAGSTRIDTAQVPALDNPHFREELATYLDKAASLADLEQIRTKAITWLRKHDRPFIDVSIPPQNISNGVVQIVVTEYTLGTIKARGADYFSPDQIKKMSGLEPGQTLSLNELRGDLDRLNRNPFLNVDAMFSPGTTSGQTDVTLNATDSLPLRVYAGFDNYGVRSLGIGEYNFGFSWGNVFQTGQIFSYQFTRTTSGRYAAHSGSDVVPLSWGDQILVFGSYETQRPIVASVFDDTGHSWQASIRYVISLPRTRQYTQSLQIGYDFKTTNNNLDFSGFNVFASQADVDQFPVIYDATLIDDWGQTAIQNTFVYSPGNITAHNSTAALEVVVPGASANYIYDRLLVTRTTKLPYDFASATRFTFQIANHNLPDSEQLSVGGVGSVRGYFTSVALGSKGVMASEEILLPPFSPLDQIVDIDDQAQLGAFYDYAELSQATDISRIANSAELASTGLTAHYSVTRYLDVRFDLGFTLRDAPGMPRRNGFGQIAVTIGY